MRTLIIPDIHGRTFWKDAVSSVTYDMAVFIGDYVDPYPWEKITRKSTISNLSEIIEFKKQNREKTILLLGNHDCSYIDRMFQRARFDSSNQYKIRELFLSNLSLFQLAYEEERNGVRYLYTHAGLIPSWLEDNHFIINKETLVDDLNKLISFKGGKTALTCISKFRTSYGAWYGSIIWSDLMERHYVNGDLPNTYQIFGHSQQEDNPVITDTFACLDIRRPFILDDDNEIKEIDGSPINYVLKK